MSSERDAVQRQDSRMSKGRARAVRNPAGGGRRARARSDRGPAPQDRQRELFGTSDSTSLEWVGGCITLPLYATDRDPPVRPELLVWMELPDGLIVAQQVRFPGEPGMSLAELLVPGMRHPMIGPSRTPDRVRVEDEETAREVRKQLGTRRIPIDVGPVPELAEIAEHMMQMPISDEDAEPESYLECGRVREETLERLFLAADVLYRSAPWRTWSEDLLLRADIPELGVDGACLCIIGQLGESFGLLIYPSIAGHAAFVAAVEGGATLDMPCDFGTTWLRLGFERGADLPKAMRREVAQHGWPVAGPEAYPRVWHHDRDGLLRPLEECDMKIVTACARAVVTLHARYGRALARRRFEPVSESYQDEQDITVRITAPYHALALFDDSPDPWDAESLSETTEDGAPISGTTRVVPKLGRNDPCHCGSGKKYKKCHLSQDQAASSAHTEPAHRDPTHALDEHWTGQLEAYALDRFGYDALEGFRHFDDPRSSLQLAVPWAVYGAKVSGSTLVDHFLTEHGRRLDARNRSWLVAQRDSWLSLWEVTAVERGRGLELRDLLSGERRTVQEVQGSQSLVERDVILARVVSWRSSCVVCGTHPRMLTPMAAARVLERIRKRLRRKRAIPVERLRNPDIGRFMIEAWEDAVFALDEQRSMPPTLTNADGDPLLLTQDVFELDAADQPRVRAALDAMDDASFDEEQDAYVFMTEAAAGGPIAGPIIVGRACLRQRGDDRLQLEIDTNSVARADRLRARIEAACGASIRHRARSHSDPASPAVLADGATFAPKPASNAGVEEIHRALLEFKNDHYATWPDIPLPALGNATPREAARTAAGRERVDLLLKDMENKERRGPPAAAFDFAPLRRELRLDP